MELLEHPDKPFDIQGRIWINKHDECFLAPGRIELLNAIMKEGSINAAAKRLGISYQHAWKTIEQMNRLSPIPVIIPKRGGKDGGGAELTNYGLKVMNEMNQLEMAFADFLLNANKHFDICF
ncbi:MAG TPA: winged helix-turn-helix domain-containing protein [Bacteroidales bacterium]